MSFTLLAAGRVTFTVERVSSGIVHGHSCVAPRKGAHGKRCTRDVRVHGSFARSGGTGANAFRFTGRLGGRALAPGSYVLVATYKGSAATAGANAPFAITP